MSNSTSRKGLLLNFVLCITRLAVGLPVQVRDAALKIADEMPKSDVNKEYYTQNMEREVVPDLTESCFTKKS